MERIISFSDVLSPEVNQEMLKILKSSNGWQIAHDNMGRDCNIIDDPHYPGVLDSDKAVYVSDAGFVQRTYDQDKPVRNEDKYNDLNAYAKLVMHICIRRAASGGYFYNNPRLYRVFWNYYSSASYGSLHHDEHGQDKDVTFTSLIYYINDCGSEHGTRVIEPGKKNHFYESKQGNAIMFPSNTLHGGTGAPHHRQRWCLNIMFDSSFRYDKDEAEIKQLEQEHNPLAEIV